MRFDLLLVCRRRLLLQFDPATRVLSSNIKRSYSQHATQALPHTQNPSPPPAKHPRGAASSDEPSPFSYARSAPKQMASRKPSRSSEPGPSTSSPKQPSSNVKRGSPFFKRSKKQSFLQTRPGTVLAGPYHNEAYIEKEHNKSPVPLKPYQKQSPKGPLNNFYQVMAGKLPTFTSIEGVIIEGNQPIRIYR